MIYFGIDVLIMFALGILSIIISYLSVHRLTSYDDDVTCGAVIGSCITMAIMLVGYVVMARVLDSMLGPYW